MAVRKYCVKRLAYQPPLSISFGSSNIQEFADGLQPVAKYGDHSGNHLKTALILDKLPQDSHAAPSERLHAYIQEVNAETGEITDQIVLF